MNVKFIGASAGSGKTHRITEELYTQLGEEKARPDAIIATTFTVKAANELVERVRLKLLKEGKYEFAHAINQSLINTVNSVCQSLLERFAFTAGISPKLEVLDENDAPILFARSLDDVLDKETLTALSHLQRKLGIENKHEGIDWTREVKRIVDLSRANGIKPEKFADQAKSSAESLLSHFPKASKISPTKDLISAIETAQKEIAAIDDTTKSTKSYLTDISKFRASLVHGYDSWSDWVKFSKAKPAKKSIAASESIRKIAAKYDSHPDLHEDLNTWIGIVFEVAGKALEAYRQEKDRLGVIDFIDQEMLCLQILDNPTVAEAISSEMDLLLVDEFQDTSPIQLALFTKLSNLANESIWVGDTKQAIFGFRGSDPDLMDLVLQGVRESDTELIESIVEAAGGKSKTETLNRSWRSIKPLVELVNELFVPAFADMLPEDQVRLDAVRTEEFDDAPLEFWDIAGRNADNCEKLAQGVLDLLNSKRLIFDKQTQQKRPVRPSDIAILARTNKKCFDIASHLAERYIPATVASPGLMSEPETYLAMAALRYLADPSDTLAIAEVINLTSGMKQEAWLKDRLDYLANKGASREWGTTGNLISEPLVALKEQRSKVKKLSPSEALVLACSTADVRRYVSAWSKDQHEALQRIANLDILAEYAKRYEESRSSGSDIATIGGLLAWFEELSKTGQDMKAVTGGDSVSILTHHRSKGLEWPVVISLDMEKEPRANHWGINVFSSEAPEFNDPLKRRVIRYWPFPFGRQQAGIPVKDMIDSSDVGSAAMRAAIEENKRLLYVSFTRARDLLVVGLQGDKPDKRHWLNSLEADWFTHDGNPLTTPNTVSMSSLKRSPSVNETTYLSGDYRVSFLERNQIANRLKLRFSPSQNSTNVAESSTPKLVEIGERIAIEGGPEIQVVGNAVHAVFAQYFNSESKPLINDLVDQILSKHGLSKCINGKEVLLAAGRLEKFLTKEYGVTSFHSEWPVSYQNSHGQVVSGWIDLIAESPEGMIIIDHKSFPGSKSDQAKRAQSYASQLAAYKDAFNDGDTNEVRSTMIYMPIGGSIFLIDKMRCQIGTIAKKIWIVPR